MDEKEKEGTRTMEGKCKELRVHFAPIETYECPLDPSKIIHLL
jgi:hypothetical protein